MLSYPNLIVVKTGKKQNAKKTKNIRKALSILGILLIISLLLILLGNPTLRGNVISKPQCNDGKDNDLDGKVDMKDFGCANRKDNDESNCGDNICTPSVESSANCVQDCGPTNSCSDNDNGINVFNVGIVSGYYNKLYYSKQDFCLDNINLNEYFCNIDLSTSITASCQTNSTNTCSNGKCIYVTPPTTTTTLAPTTTTLPPTTTTMPITTTTTLMSSTTTTLQTTTTTLSSTTTTIINSTTTTIPSTTTTLPVTTTTTTLMNSTTTTTMPNSNSCSTTWNGICPSGCSAGSDYDCCTQAGYCWRPGQGCYSTC